ncbi:hypothetical protein V7S43_013418 [Phytophthora oleae]|uniref:Amino acid transporter transmembrane domain-containing protein n=1 Tax=Phytophthora oleae TaxID=2107226 RepID=A0ABD3F826_9STRA
MIFANTYTTIKLAKVMLAAPSAVKMYGGLGEWALGTWGRFFTVVSQVGVCLLVPRAFLVLDNTLLDVLFQDSYRHIFCTIFMALMTVPVWLIPTMKESAGMAFAGCMDTIIADAIALSVLLWKMLDHGLIPSPDVTLYQVLTSFGKLALAYGAVIVVADISA